MKKALVIGSIGNEGHENAVRSYFLSVASGWSCDIAILGSSVPYDYYVYYGSSIHSIIEFAVNNQYDIIIRSYSGVYSYKLEWEYAYENGIMVFHAHGSNSNTYLSNPPFLMKSCVCVGGGITSNIRSYGPGLDVYAHTLTNATEESFATPIVAAHFAKLKDAYPSSTLDELRQRLYQSSSLYSNGWSAEQGFGKSNYNYSGSLNVGTPFEINASRSIDSKTAIVSFKKYNNLPIRIIDESSNILYEGESETYTYYAHSDEIKTFKLYSNNTVLSRDEIYTSKTLTGFIDGWTLGFIGSIKAIKNSTIINLTLPAVNNALYYELYKNNTLMYTGTSTIHSDSIYTFGTYTYKYRAYGPDGQVSNFSEDASITFTQDIIGTIGTMSLLEMTEDYVRISFTAVTNAQIYDIYINDELYSSITGTSFTYYPHSTRMYNIYYKARRSDFGVSYESAISVPLEFFFYYSPMTNVGTISYQKTYAGFKLIADAVEGAEIYMFYVDNELYTSLTNELTVNLEYNQKTRYIKYRASATDDDNVVHYTQYSAEIPINHQYVKNIKVKL